MTKLDSLNKAEIDFLYICKNGQKTASYKLALAMSLLDLKDCGKTVFSLDEIAPLFVDNLIRHISRGKKQFNNDTGSAVIRIIYRYTEGLLDYDEMIEFVKKKWYQNVVYRFHNLRGNVDVTQFYIIDGSDSRNIKIELTSAMLSLLNSKYYTEIQTQVEELWNSLEEGWGDHSLKLKIVNDDNLNVSRPSHKTCISNMSRKALSHLGHDLNVDNRNECFYCGGYIDIDGYEDNKDFRWAVDHFLPHTLLSYNPNLPIEEPFNYVLACKKCNSSKGMKTPLNTFLIKLIMRNERLIETNSKFKSSILELCGQTPTERLLFSIGFYNDCKKRNGAEEWEPNYPVSIVHDHDSFLIPKNWNEVRLL